MQSGRGRLRCAARCIFRRRHRANSPRIPTARSAPDPSLLHPQRATEPRQRLRQRRADAIGQFTPAEGREIARQAAQFLPPRHHHQPLKRRRTTIADRREGPCLPASEGRREDGAAATPAAQPEHSDCREAVRFRWAHRLPDPPAPDRRRRQRLLRSRFAIREGPAPFSQERGRRIQDAAPSVLADPPPPGCTPRLLYINSSVFRCDQNERLHFRRT